MKVFGRPLMFNNFYTTNFLYKTTSRRIKCQPNVAIFDMAGTIVDHGSLAPVVAMQNAFLRSNLLVNKQHILPFMGLNKREHIKSVLDLLIHKKEVVAFFVTKENLIDQIYFDFKRMQCEILHKDEFSDFLPGVLEFLNMLRNKGFKLAVNTGYNKDMQDIILRKIYRKHSFEFDAYVNSDDVKNGRPKPDMLLKVMDDLEVEHPEQCIVFDDSPVGIKAANTIGAHSVAVLCSSACMGLDRHNFIHHSFEAREKKLLIASEQLKSANTIVPYVSSAAPYLEKLINPKNKSSKSSTMSL